MRETPCGRPFARRKVESVRIRSALISWRMIETLFGRLARIDRTANRMHCHGLAFLKNSAGELRFGLDSIPKKRGPDQWVPLIARAASVKLLYRLPSCSNPSSTTNTRCVIPRHSRTNTVPVCNELEAFGVTGLPLAIANRARFKAALSASVRASTVCDASRVSSVQRPDPDKCFCGSWIEPAERARESGRSFLFRFRLSELAESRFLPRQ